MCRFMFWGMKAPGLSPSCSPSPLSMCAGDSRGCGVPIKSRALMKLKPHFSLKMRGPAATAAAAAAAAAAVRGFDRAPLGEVY